jgi:hypothetical protein
MSAFVKTQIGDLSKELFYKDFEAIKKLLQPFEVANLPQGFPLRKLIIPSEAAPLSLGKKLAECLPQWQEKNLEKYFFIFLHSSQSLRRYKIIHRYWLTCSTRCILVKQNKLSYKCINIEPAIPSRLFLCSQSGKGLKNPH